MIKSFNNITGSENGKRIITNFFSLVVLRGFQFLIPLVTLPYLVRTIGIANFGLVNFALSLGIYFGAIIQFGFGVTATREIARNRQNPKKLSQIYSSTLVASCLLAVLCVFLYVPMIFVVEQFREYLSLYLFTMGFVVFQSLFPIWFFQGMEKMKYITFLSLGTSTLFLISVFTFVKKQEDFFLVPLLNGIAAFITFTVAIVLIRKQFKVCFVPPTYQEIKILYQSGRHAFIGQLAPNLYNNSSVFLLGLFTSSSVVGLYSAAAKVVDAAISFAYILSNTFFPYLSRNLQKHKAFQKIMLSTGLALTMGTFLLSKEIAGILFGGSNVEIATYIESLSICIFLIFATLTYGTNYLMLVGKDSAVKNIALYSSLVFFGVALVVIPIWGVWGAVLTIAGARMTVMIFTVAFYFKYK